MFFDLLKYPLKVGSIDVKTWGLKNPKLFEQVEIYSETSVHYPQPETLEEKNVFNAKSIPVPPMSVTKIKGGKCFTKNGLVLTPENKPLADFTPLNTHPLKNKRHYKFKNCEKINGSVAVLTNDSCQRNYYHWLIENVSRLDLLEKSGFKADKYLINNDCSYQRRVLDLLGINESKIIKLEPNRLIQADELIAPSIVNYFEEIKGDDRTYFNAKFITPWSIEFFRKKFLPLVKETKPKKIYISRKNAPYRKVANEDEVIEYLSKYGYESYCLEDLDFLDQTELFYNATHVISLHGAGLTNIMFCKKDTKVLEFFDPDYLYQGQQMIALKLGLKYNYSYIIPLWEKHSGIRDCKITVDSLKNFSLTN